MARQCSRTGRRTSACRECSERDQCRNSHASHRHSPYMHRAHPFGSGASLRTGDLRMKLDGIHHITAITGDALGNVDFYARVLGLRLVKKSVNQDDPTVYHLFYADENASPGADLTFFEYPGAARGKAGAGMVHRIVWRVASESALEFLA